MDTSLNTELCLGCQTRYVAESSLKGDFIDAKDSMKERFNIHVGILLTCSRCKIAKYCSKECQKNDWKNHKRVCVEKLSPFDDEVDNYINNPQNYVAIANLETVIFQDLNKCANVEAMAFPFLFPFGVGFFDCPSVSTKRRFKDYHQQMLANKQFANSMQWKAWALQTEKEVHEELRKRVTLKYMQSKKSKNNSMIT